MNQSFNGRRSTPDMGQKGLGNSVPGALLVADQLSQIFLKFEKITDSPKI